MTFQTGPSVSQRHFMSQPLTFPQVLHLQGSSYPAGLPHLEGAYLCAAHELQSRLKDQPDWNVLDAFPQPLDLQHAADPQL